MDEREQREHLVCPLCGERGERVWVTPPNTHHVTYPDGWRRQNHDDWKIMRDYQKTRNKKIGTADPDEKNRLSKEMVDLAKKFRPKKDREVLKGSAEKDNVKDK